MYKIPFNLLNKLQVHKKGVTKIKESEQKQLKHNCFYSETPGSVL